MEKYELQSFKQKTGYNLEQLELDYYQHFILSRLFDLFNTVYFKGGTCLQKCYGIKRFSEDLDFNYFDLPPTEIISQIENVCEEKITDYHETRFGMSFKIRFKGILFNGSNQSLCRVSFDFRENDIYNQPIKKIIRPIYYDLPNYFILALNTEEILAEKIRAIITRYKARDVFDLNELLLNNVKVDFNLINKKLQTYNKIFIRKTFEIKLEEKRKIYDQELQRLTKVYDDFDTCKVNILKQIE
ncbi:MAG TPA: nucleotidyl transferase AbiEii/AbiGii toxin family protein [Bacteroidales bacterium]|nr:nucleotidyl transferase AbiEii/AbiGii toxin family protein [Bacteroidales bacterium]